MRERWDWERTMVWELSLTFVLSKAGVYVIWMDELISVLDSVAWRWVW